MKNYIKKFLNRMLKSKILKICLFSSFLLVAVSLLITFNIPMSEENKDVDQQYTFLARAFLDGRLYFQGDEPAFQRGFTDMSFFKGRGYWPLGPFPAIVLMPFVAMWDGMRQGHLSIILIVASFYFLYKLAKKFNFSKNNATWLSIFFIFGSAYLGFTFFPIYGFFAHIVGVFLLLSALYFFIKKRLWFVGILLGLAIATRGNYILAPLFFILMLLTEKESLRLRVTKILKLCTPIIIIFIMLLMYNFLRFEQPFNSGYDLQDLDKIFIESRAQGVFSLKHVPTNLYYFLFSGPLPVLKEDSFYALKYPFMRDNGFGLSILFTSPLFLYIFSARWQNRMVWAAAITSLLMLAFVLMFYGSGYDQYGYRFAVDFYPFLYLILLNSCLARQFSIKAKILIILSIFFNFYLLLT